MSASPAFSQASLEAKNNGKPYHKLINGSQFKNLLIVGSIIMINQQSLFINKDLTTIK